MKKVKRLRKGELKELHLKESDFVDKTPCGNGEWSVDINDKILCMA